MTAAPSAHRIRCGGIWGGITAVDLDVRTQAINASIQSTASGGKKGGDIYYFSVCSSDVLTRIALADMRGHGEQVSHLSQWLYDSLEQRMNSLDGASVLTDLNGLVYAHGFEALTTAAVVGYYIGDSSLYYSYAGHPPILVRQGHSQWMARPIDGNGGPANLPLGALRTVRYDQEKIGLESGDRIFLYTDGIVECPDPDGEFYGEARLLDVLERAAGASLTDVKQAVVQSLASHARGPLIHDDCTLMVVEVRETA